MGRSFGDLMAKRNQPRVAWWRLVLLSPLFILLVVMNGRVDGRVPHLLLSFALLLMSLCDQRMLAFCAVYFSLALVNYFSGWVIMKVCGLSDSDKAESNLRR